jgi:hypothetical protein
VLDQAGQDAGREQRLTAVRASDGVDELVGVGVLEQEAAGPGLQGRVDVLVELEHAQHQHAGRQLRGDGRGGLDAVPTGHADVHEHDVGSQVPGAGHGLGPGGGLADDREVRGGVDEHREAVPQQRLVVDDEHAHLGRGDR